MSIGGGYPGFLARLRGRMTTLGLSESRLARRLGTKQQNITRWFRGSWPGGEWFQRLPAALECSAQWLLTEQGSPLPEKADQGEVYRLAKQVAAEELRLSLRDAIDGIIGPTELVPAEGEAAERAIRTTHEKSAATGEKKRQKTGSSGS